MIRFSFIYLFIITTSFSLFGQNNCYESDYVEQVNAEYKGDKYSVIKMYRDGGRVNAKYFAAQDYQGNSVYNRYQNWKQTESNIILVSSGTYMDNSTPPKPQGLTIDNGVSVNKALIYDRMDALVIVYATGGVAVSDLREGNLTLSGGGVDPNRKFNIRGSSRDLYDFMKWAESQEATVFQTHLLVYRNKVEISSTNSSRTARERRFLAVGKDSYGDIVHMIVFRPDNVPLYKGSAETLEFLNKFSEVEVIFMINLDTGYQDVFQFNNPDCSVNQTVKGKKALSQAVNLLVYYFK